MSLSGYDIEPLTLKSVAAGMDGHVADVAAQRELLSTAVSDAVAGVLMPPIQAALAESWNGMLGEQVLAAENRMANATETLRQVVTAVAEGDQQMMDTANANAEAAPDLAELERKQAGS